jgi:hypothetical protein
MPKAVDRCVICFCVIHSFHQTDWWCDETGMFCADQAQREHIPFYSNNPLRELARIACDSSTTPPR